MTLRRAITLIFWGWIFCSFIRPVTDPDFWWNLKAGELIALQGIPGQDVFSFTMAGRPWVNYEWLAQIALWKIHALGGMPAIIVFAAAVCVLTLGFVFTASGPPRPGSLLLFVLPVLVFQSAAGSPRPALFSYLFFAAFVYVLENVKNRRWDPKTLFWLLPAMAVWANLHPGFVYGIAAFCVYLAGEILQKSERRRIGFFVAVFFGLILMSFVNPYHVRMLPHVLARSVAASDYFFIQEWQSPGFHGFRYWPFLFMIAACVWAFFFDKKKPADFTEWALFSVTAAASFVSVRHLPFFALANAPAFLRHTTSYYKGKRPYIPKISLAYCVAAFLVFAAAMLCFGVAGSGKILQNDEAVARAYPVKALAFMREKGMDKKRIYNDYAWGGYLIGREIPVFIDGRADVYRGQFLRSYFHTYYAAENWRDALKAHSVDCLLIRRESTLAVVAAESSEWAKVYSDNLASVFVKI